MLPLGTTLPSFALVDPRSNHLITLKEHAGSVATIIAFICNHCPYVKHINHELPRLAKDYASRGVSFIAINSNDAKQYPDDSTENMIITANELEYNFPYLYDDTQEVAKAYHAMCTPDFFVGDHNLKLVYRGELDESRIGNNIAVTGSSIRQALDCLINKTPIPDHQKPSLGCSIKWACK